MNPLSAALMDPPPVGSSSPAAVSVDVDVDRRVRAGRVARVVGGGVLIAGPVLVGAVIAAAQASVFTSVPALLVVWLTALGAGFAAYRYALSPRSDGTFDLDAFPVASFVAPAVGLSIMGPLSLHAIVGFGVWLGGVISNDHSAIVGFDGYAAFALIGTLHVHIVFAIAMALAAHRAVHGPTHVTLWPAVVFSAVPGIILVFPPLLVFVTGFVLSRAFLWRAARWREGAVL